MTEPRWLSPAQARAWLGYRRMRALLDLQLTRDLVQDCGLSEADYDVLSNVSEAAAHSLRPNASMLSRPRSAVSTMPAASLTM